MARPLDADGQGGANDGSVAVYFCHHNGLIPPDFPKGSDRKYFLYGFHKIYLVSRFFIVGSASDVNQFTPKDTSNSFWENSTLSSYIIFRNLISGFISGEKGFHMKSTGER